MGKRLEAAKRVKPFYQKGAQSLADSESLNVKSIYLNWSDCVAAGQIEYDQPGYKFTYNDELYKCVNPDPTFQSDWIPSDLPALYVRIDETHAGSIDDPIPAARGMEYTYFLYYLDAENGLTYLCQYGDTDTQGTVVLAYLPHEVPTYFKVVEV